MKKINIAIFASGSGTNAENIIKYFTGHELAMIVLVLTNNNKAGVIKRSRNMQTPVYVFDKEMIKNGDVLNQLRQNQIDFIVLAGYLWLVPNDIIKAYPDKIVNIHPALLPKYGGKGMYGMNVHNAVVANGDRETGITIHMVNEEYDKGDIVFQAKCTVDKNDGPEDVASKVHVLEYEHFPRVIDQLIRK